MKNTNKTKVSLVEELEALYRRVVELEQSETKRNEAEELYATLANKSPVGVYIIQDGKFVFVNPEFLKYLGFTEDELLGTDPLRLVYPENRELVRQNAVDMLRGYHLSPYEFRVIRRNGEWIWAIETVTSIQYRGKRATLGNFMNVTERKQAEERIRRAAEEWRTTFDSITELVSIHDTDFKLVRVNKAFANTCKMKPAELVGKTCYEVVHGTHEPVPNCPHKKTMETKKAATEEFFEPHLGIHLEVSASPICNEKGEVTACVHIAKDITERKLMEGQLIITDRLASIGELASGIAHELNNPLTSVIGFSQLLLDKDIPNDVKEDVGIIHREAQRTAEVVKNLLTFARKHIPAKQLVNINSIITRVLELRAYEQRVSNIQVNIRFDLDLPEIVADYFQLQQVFLNIIINAEHFMIEAHGRGTLTITTKRTGDIITVSFTDDGPGIQKEDLGHLFDPFFTTKEVGKGTGLGLSICHGVISEHGGRIYVESKLGKGATFVVELPIGNH